MKVYLIYDEGPPSLHHKLAITLPSKWLDQSADKVKELFVDKYNKKFPETPLDDEELVLAVKEETVEEAAQEALAVTEELVVDLKAAVLMELLVEMVVMEQGHNMAVEGIQAAKMVRRELVAVLVLLVVVERITAVVVT